MWVCECGWCQWGHVAKRCHWEGVAKRCHWEGVAKRCHWEGVAKRTGRVWLRGVTGEGVARV